MSTFGAAAKKKTHQITSTSLLPLKKRKVQDADLPKTLVEDHVSDSAKPRSDDLKSSVLSQTVDHQTTELKSQIVLLKKKPDEFDPRLVSCWENGERVPFIFLCLAFDMISAESSRNVIIDILCNMLRTVLASSPEDLLPIVYLAVNKIAPAHHGLELGIGTKDIIKAISEAFGSSVTHVEKQNKKLGDLGDVAKASRFTQTMLSKPKPLTVVKVFNAFRQIAKETGKRSKEKKKDLMKALLVATTDIEPLYLIRLLEGKLRLSFQGKTLLAALGQASVYNEEHSMPPSNIESPLQEAAKIVQQVFTVIPVYDIIVSALLNGGVWNLSKTCKFTLGVPVAPMLAKPTTRISEILNLLQDTDFTCEYKYDGERAQIHCMEDGTFEIFSKKGERNTGKYPDVVLALASSKKPAVKSCVLDCEVVAFDRKTKKILPFQILSTRARKDVNASDIKVDVCIFAFDILYLNGQQLIQESLNIRREKLYDSFEETPGYFQFATALTSSDTDAIQTFFSASLDIGCEGLIIKTLNSDATYEPAKRSNNWLKLKKDYMDSFGDSLDLVPIAASYGSGKRTGVFGTYLLACYDADNEVFQSICNVGTGFSNAQLEELSSSLSSKVIANGKQYQVGDSFTPDVWFEPSVVWEVKGADLSLSPKQPAAAGFVDPIKGISLRFPRLLRVREDKKPEEATSSEQIAEMFKAQKHNHPSIQDESEGVESEDD